MFTFHADVNRVASYLGVLNQVESGTIWVMRLHYHMHGHEYNEGRYMRNIGSYSREFPLFKYNNCNVQQMLSFSKKR